MGDRPSCFSACFIWACRYFLSCVILFMRPALFLFCWYCKSTITGSFFSSALSKTRWRMTKLFPASGIFLLRQPHNCAILSSVVDRSTVCQIGYGALAQLVARYIRIVEVTGSNPVCSTTEKLENTMFSGFFFSLSSTLHNGFHNSSYPDIPDTVDKLLFPLRLRMGIYVGRRAIV